MDEVEVWVGRGGWRRLLTCRRDGRRWMKKEGAVDAVLACTIQIQSNVVTAHSFATEVQLFALYYSMSQLLQV